MRPKQHRRKPDEAERQRRADELQRHYIRSVVLILLACVADVVAFFVFASLSDYSRTGSAVVFFAIKILAVGIMCSGMISSCIAKGQPREWVIIAALLLLIGTAVLALLLIGLLPDRNKRFRARAREPHLYLPAFYSLLLCVPAPCFGLPLGIYAAIQIKQSDGRRTGQRLAMTAICVSSTVLILFVIMVATDPGM